jgi:hypothetical protein
MTEHYEDEDEAPRERALSNLQVLGFIAGFWMRQPWRRAGWSAPDAAGEGPVARHGRCAICCRLWLRMGQYSALPPAGSEQRGSE